VTTCTQRSDQSADPAIRLFQRGKIAQLAANVDRKPLQFQTVKHRQTIVDVRHVGDRDAEFVFLPAGRDFGMRAGIDIGFTRNTAGAAISASVLPTPENTMSSDRIPASSARRNSPPDTISAPNRDWRAESGRRCWDWLSPRRRFSPHGNQIRLCEGVCSMPQSLCRIDMDRGADVVGDIDKRLTDSAAVTTEALGMDHLCRMPVTATFGLEGDRDAFAVDHQRQPDENKGQQQDDQ
jgi:hypothetical protein